ncbi:MAG: hypothetical protein DI538_16220 [Azospira oryzae]|nr:hypothetical protein [Cytophaga sp.]PZR34704.1 MAG: hypothetical protein DI538_16220 [Azospira oryzae]
METRLKMNELEPNAFKAMFGLSKYLETTGLTGIQMEMIKIRASQINGCAYCLDMHTKDARKLGETEQRIYTLSAWREAPYFSEEERAILALTEEVTLIQNRVSDETYTHAVKLLGEKCTAQVIMAIVTINAWNRIGVSTQMIPPVG